MDKEAKGRTAWRIEDQEWWQKYSASVSNSEAFAKKTEGSIPASAGNTSGILRPRYIGSLKYHNGSELKNSGIRYIGSRSGSLGIRYVGSGSGSLGIRYIGSGSGGLGIRYIGSGSGSLGIRYVGSGSGSLGIRYVGSGSGSLGIRYAGSGSGSLGIRYIGSGSGSFGIRKSSVRPRYFGSDAKKRKQIQEAEGVLGYGLDLI